MWMETTTDFCDDQFSEIPVSLPGFQTKLKFRGSCLADALAFSKLGVRR